MVYTLEQLRSLVAPVAEKYRLKAVYVFGSYARGEATEESDVDMNHLNEWRLRDNNGTVHAVLFFVARRLEPKLPECAVDFILFG